ncbi:uncharacterized protein LOC119400176 [Rhipicephalus sanguineus]|uniref:uncharacterized protein LOC119400176 n=1 Tax=Rhipicephalus sanguineus TaxID=34632 RepID=UPI0020C4B501|nr:uncharacterized protein LOC119400176 [Rhipicephalus sanguineus]
METSEPVIIIEIPRETVTRSDAAVQTMAVGGNGKTGTMAANVTRIQDALCAMQPYSIVNDMQADDAAISPAAAQDKQDYLKFMLPPSFGVWYDAFLQSKRPITRKVRTHIISVLFKACYRTTLYPTSRLYQKVLDSLVAKYPHVIEGKYNRRKWSIALRSRFKNARKNLVVAAAAVKVQRTCGIERLLADADDEHAYAHTQLALASQKTSLSSSGVLSDCEDKSVHEEELGESKNTTAHDAEAKNSSNMEAVPLDSVELCLVSEPTECVKKSEHLEDEESMDCPDYSDAVLEDFTVSDLLGMCTDEKASEALMAQQENRVSLDERENCDEPVEEVSPQEVEPSSKPEQQVDAPSDELDCEVVAQSSKPAQQAEGPLHEHDHMVPVPSSKLEQQVEAPLDEPDHVVLAPGLKPTEQAEVPLHESDRMVLVPNSNPVEQAERHLQEHDHTVLVPSSKPEQQMEAPLNEPNLVGFELPSFGIFDELLRMQVPVSHTMQWHIVFSLFNALSKKTM